MCFAVAKEIRADKGCARELQGLRDAGYAAAEKRWGWRT
jgi:hypothetical protein